MFEVKCVGKERNKRNEIISYTIQDTSGNRKSVTASQLKGAIKQNKVRVSNLTLTSDGRLVDKKEENLSNNQIATKKSAAAITVETIKKICSVMEINFKAELVQDADDHAEYISDKEELMGNDYYCEIYVYGDSRDSIYLECDDIGIEVDESIAGKGENRKLKEQIDYLHSLLTRLRGSGIDYKKNPYKLVELMSELLGYLGDSLAEEKIVSELVVASKNIGVYNEVKAEIERRINKLKNETKNDLRKQKLIRLYEADSDDGYSVKEITDMMCVYSILMNTEFERVPGIGMEFIRMLYINYKNM